MVGEITTFNKKTGKEINRLFGKCVVCDRQKSMFVTDDTIETERLGSFCRNLGNVSAKVGKNIATNVIKNPGRALEITLIFATAAATKSPKAALSSLPEAIYFYHTGKGLYLIKFV